MNRLEVAQNLKAVRSKIVAIVTAEPRVYKTENKFIPKIGYVHEITTLRDCAKALSLIKRKFDSEASSADELGLSLEDIKTDSNFLGFNFETWKSDIQQRVDELKEESLLEGLYKAKSLLEKHRSADDVFNDDMDNIAGILAQVK